MDLTKMTRGELATLQNELRTVSSAADVLAEGGQEPEISLTAWETAIRCAPLAAFAQPERAPQLLERSLPPVADFTIDSIGSKIPLGGGTVAEPMLSPAPAETPEILPPSPPPAVVAAPDGDPSAVRGAETAAVAAPSGPLTDEEKAEIRRRHAAGEDATAIAAALNRKRPAVSMFLMRAAARKSDADTFRPVDEVAAEVVKAAAAARPAASPPPSDPLAAKLLAHICALPPAKGMDAETDLEIVEAFVDGRPGSEVALDLGLDTKAVKARLDQITAPLRDVLGKLPRGDSPGFATLTRLLRDRVALTRRG